MKGFFANKALLPSKAPLSLIPKCGACGLFKTCMSPKMSVKGKGKRGIMIIGDAPGSAEDKQGRPFVGEEGQVLQSTLRRLGVDMWEDCWVTNSIICRPPKGRQPADKEIGFCQPNLVRAVTEHKPNIIIPLGTAVKSLFSWLWKSDVGSITRWAGWRIPCQKPNAWICPTFHPWQVLRAREKRDKTTELFFTRHLKAALAKSDRPWQEIVDYTKKVQRVLDHREAARLIDEFARSKRSVAIDYETNMLKPDHSDAEILSCSLSDGKKTIAYPWHGRAIEATRLFLRSAVPKIASNLKFEQRWTMALLGCEVNNWDWDTMLAAHWLDNRRSIASIKFQAFVLLGTPSWDDHIETYKESPTSNTPNRLKELPIDQLLTYNGLDSLYEWMVADLQTKIGVDWEGAA